MQKTTVEIQAETSTQAMKEAAPIFDNMFGEHNWDFTEFYVIPNDDVIRVTAQSPAPPRTK